jgi:molybdate transport system regulatory protein
MSRKKRQVLPRFRVLLGREIALGPGKVDLLDHIERTGSILEAAQRMDMSYNRAWQLVHTMNDCFKQPLVSAARGGKTGGGAALTANGRKMLALYRRLEKECDVATHDARRSIVALLKS